MKTYSVLYGNQIGSNNVADCASFEEAMEYVEKHMEGVELVKDCDNPNIDIDKFGSEIFHYEIVSYEDEECDDELPEFEFEFQSDYFFGEW